MNEDLLLATIKDVWAGDKRVEAIDKLSHRSDAEFISALIQALEDNHGNARVLNAALVTLERIGTKAVPALVASLANRCWYAADVLSKIGGAEAKSAIEKALSERPDILRLQNALQRFVDPVAAKEREEREKAEVRTVDPEVAVRAIFYEFATKISVLSSDRIDSYYSDWSSGNAIGCVTGSQSMVESIIRRHLQSLQTRPGFETFRIQFNDRWECVFVHTFYQGVASSLLLWRGADFYKVAHT